MEKTASRGRTLSPVSLVAAFSASVVGIILFFCASAGAATMPIPSGTEAFHHEMVGTPVLSMIPAGAKPLATTSDGEHLTVSVGFPGFDGPVDLYVGVYSPGLGPDLLLLREDGTIRSSAEGVLPWKRGMSESFVEAVFSDIPVGGLPAGSYTLYAGVTPAGSTSAYYLWYSTLEISPTTIGRVSPALSKVEDCDDVVETLKTRAVAEMEETIENLMKEVRQWGGCVYPYPVPLYDFSAAPVSGGAEGGARVYSETNVQVPGVDEADFLKNDGSYIYILADGRLQIVDAWPPEESRVVGSIRIEGEPKKLFVTADRALVYSSLDFVDPVGPYADPWMNFRWQFPFMEECTHGYDCDFTGDGRNLKITVLDIADRSRPVVEREFRFNGSFINARRIGAAVHSVVSFPPVSFPDVSYWPEIMDRCYTEDAPTVQELLDAFRALEDRNRTVLMNATLTDWLPSMREIRYEDGRETSRQDLLTDCSGFYVGELADGRSFLSVVSLDMDRVAEASASTIVGRPGAVYASADALYVGTRHTYYGEPVGGGWGGGGGWFFPDVWGMPVQTTAVHKFSLGSGPASTEYRGSGVVKGHVLNQFSMDEHQGYFRIATTSNWAWDRPTHSTVSVLEERGGELALVGQVDDLAPTEDIRSARFSGDRGFLVTFKKTDPLFALDLSVPTRPRVAGQLKIPGFSTYMQFMDEDHLLTIGYDAEDMGQFAWFQGIMLQIFDVGNLTAPILLHKEFIGTRGTTSEAATNHLAFNYFAPKDLLAIPATVCEGGSGGGSYGTTMTFSGLLVYDVTVDDGFSYRGGVEHVPPRSPWGYTLCNDWWTRSSSVVERSIFMDDYVFSVARDLIKVNHLDSLGTDLAVVDLIPGD